MYCYDFNFNGEKLSNHGFIICTFDGESSWDGADITFTTVQPPSFDKYDYYTYSYESPLSCKFQIGKNDCENTNQEDLYVTQDDYSDIMRWLQRPDGYYWFNFEQEGWEDVYYLVQINVQPIQLNGRTIGFELTLNMNAPYGYSQLMKKSFTLTKGDTFDFKVYSDMIGVIYPKTTITANASGSINLKTGCNEYNKTTIINNVAKGDIIVLDENNDYYSGILNPNNFNFEFPILANSYDNITTFFTNNGISCKINIEYRHIRRVTV